MFGEEAKLTAKIGLKGSKKCVRLAKNEENSYCCTYGFSDMV